MADTIPLDYQIRITRSGDGANTATAELTRFKASADQATAATKTLSEATRQHEGSTRSLATTLSLYTAGTITVGAAIRTVVSYTQNAIAAAKEHETTVARLNGTLRATSQYSQEASQEIQRFSQELTKGTRYTVDAATGVQTLLLSFGATRKDLPLLTKNVLDLSAGLGVDLHTSTMMVARALEGNFGILHQYGFQISQTATLGENLNSVLEQLQQRFGGLAQAEGNTLTGRLETLKKDFNELAITIGEKLLPLLAPAAGQATIPAQLNAYLKGANPTQKYTRDQYEGEVNTAQTARGNIESELNDLLAQGKLTPAQHAALGDKLASGFAPTQSLRFTERVTALGPEFSQYKGPDLEAAQAAINAVLPELNKVLAGANATGPEAKQTVSPSGQAQLEEREAALGKIKTLTDQINDATLQGLDREDAKALQTFQKRASEIDVLAHKAQLSDAERVRLQAQNFDALTAEQDKIATQRAAQAQREADAARLEIARATHEKLRVFEEGLSISAIGYGKDRTRAADYEYAERLRAYDALKAGGELDETEYTRLAEDASLKRQRIFAEEAQKRLEYLQTHKTGFAALEGDLTKLGDAAEVQFSARLSNALVEGFRNGHIELQKFASDFFAFIAQAILQALILRAVQSTIGGFFGGGGISGSAGVDSAGGSLAGAAANGTVRYAANGLSTVSTPTFFPRHNVIAGEAGPEVLAVLSKPRTVRVGSRYAAEGMVNGQPVALVPGGVSGLGGGAGGQITIQISHTPEVQARIEQNSIQGAVLQITRDLGKDTPIANATRRLTQTS